MGDSMEGAGTGALILTGGALEASGAMAGPEAFRLLCRTCGKQYAKYTCPRCNARSCSLVCYKSHSSSCTEGFYRESLVRELQGMRSSGEDRQRMLATLQRLHLQDEEGAAEELLFDASDDVESEAEGDDTTVAGLSAETVAKVLAGEKELSLEDLTADERKALRRAAVTGELSRLVDIWQPWWTLPGAASLSLSGRGMGLVEEQTEDAESGAEASSFPLPPAADLPPLTSLSQGTPSPLLSIHLMDILYAYCFTLRLYNGEWTSEPAGAATALSGVSPVLGCSATPETVDEALSECLQRVCSPEWRDCGGAEYGVSLMSDVTTVMGLGRPSVVRALADMQRMVQAAMSVGFENVKTSQVASGKAVSAAGGKNDPKKSKHNGSRNSRRLQLMSYKLQYFLSWANEQPPNVYTASAALVRAVHQKHMEQLTEQTTVAGTTAASVGSSHRPALPSRRANQPSIIELPEQ